LDQANGFAGYSIRAKNINAYLIELLGRAGHLPNTRDLFGTSRASRSIKVGLSAFDAKQQKLDEALDKTLDICRC
jgi:hypothetical protein